MDGQSGLRKGDTKSEKHQPIKINVSTNEKHKPIKIHVSINENHQPIKIHVSTNKKHQPIKIHVMGLCLNESEFKFFNHSNT
jgi:predicted PilT family ATPase